MDLYRKRTCRPLLITLFLGQFMMSCGGGGGSTETTIVRPPSTISAPSSIIAVAGNNSVALTWSAVTGAHSYRVYRSVSTPVTKSPGSLIAADLMVTTLTDTSAVSGIAYYYFITAVANSGESAGSVEVYGTPGMTGILRGSIRYEDREYGSAGFTGNKTWKNVRYADIDVIEDVSGSVLYSTTTDSRGNFSLSTSPSLTQVYVRVNSSAAPVGSGSLLVTDLTGSFYGVPSDAFGLSGSASVVLSIPTYNAAAGAFNILDVMTSGYEFIRALDGVYPSASLNAYWAPGNIEGTYYCEGYYCTAGDGIYVLSQTYGDTDEFDDDVLWHEFGHYVASTLSLDQSPGGWHYLTDNDHDLRFSWSEGWGSFMTGAIKSWLASINPACLSTPAGQSASLYVDTSGSGGFSFDFGNVSASPSFFYASGEVAVAKVLLGIRSVFSMQDIWDIVASFRSSPPVTPVNLELFWDRWMAGKPTSSGGITVQSLFEERQILYRDDEFEQDDTPGTAVNLTVGAVRTLFGDGDGDHVKFTPSAGISYTIRTSSLRGGADTAMELYDNFGVLLLSNDNDNPPYICIIESEFCSENGNDVLSSTITLPASGSTPTGPYIVRVKSSPARPPSAGRYGTYSLSISTP